MEFNKINIVQARTLYRKMGNVYVGEDKILMLPFKYVGFDCPLEPIVKMVSFNQESKCIKKKLNLKKLEYYTKQKPVEWME